MITDFLKFYREIKEKTRKYNLGEKGLEKELIRLHEQLLREIPKLQEKAERNLRVLKFEGWG